MHLLKSTLNPNYLLDESKSKKIWNFVKLDIAKLLKKISCDANLKVLVQEDKSFLIDHQPNNQHHKIKIGHDLQFVSELELQSNAIEFLALILAILIRLQRTYKKAFLVTCDHYPVLARAREMMREILAIKVSHNWLCSFIQYPVPGRRPVNGKPLTVQEVSKRYTVKRQAQGNVQLKTWIKKSIKEQLDAYCKLKGCKLEDALAEIIPLGLNIGTYLNIKAEQTK